VTRLRQVVALHALLERSPFDEVRRLARDVRAGYAAMADSGELAAGQPLPNAEHVRELVELLDEAA